MQGYFDIHSHILPGVDDGAGDMEETKRILLAAYEQGIRIIAATPHFSVGGESVKAERLKELHVQVQQMAEDISDEVQIILGNEILYSTDIIDALNSGEALTMDGTRYVLIEFHRESSFRWIWEGISQCIFAGYIPILAHSERYQCLLKDYGLTEELIKSGAYIQLNLNSISGRIFDRETRYSRTLLKRGWVHFLGTDCHNIYNRAPQVHKAAHYIRKHYGQSMLRQLLWENPMCMVEDKHL